MEVLDGQHQRLPPADGNAELAQDLEGSVLDHLRAGRDGGAVEFGDAEHMHKNEAVLLGVHPERLQHCPQRRCDARSANCVH